MEAQRSSLPPPRAGGPGWRAYARHAVALLIVAALVGACDGSSGKNETASSGDPATWQLLGEVSAESSTLEIGVSRLGCASGVTGEVLEPRVAYEAERIVIEVDVAPFGEGAANCPGNDVVAVSVDLQEQIGDRELVDGACLEGEAATTTFCENAVRWP